MSFAKCLVFIAAEPPEGLPLFRFFTTFIIKNRLGHVRARNIRDRNQEHFYSTDIRNQVRSKFSLQDPITTDVLDVGNSPVSILLSNTDLLGPGLEPVHRDSRQAQA